MINYTVDELADFIDHTNLKAYATYKDMENLCNEAKKYNFKMVAINPVQSKICSIFLKDTSIHVGAAISFPLGQTSIESKVFETENSIKNGANEIDYVINITEVKTQNYEYIKDEMQRIVEVCRKNNVLCKVIFENCYLEKEEIVKLSKIAKEIKPDFIKTSTGFGTSGANYEDVKLMKDTVGDSVKVKAAGGIRNSEDFIKMIEAGAERIGTSAGITIIESIKESLAKENKTTVAIGR